jgi:S1/P1 Nuclease
VRVGPVALCIFAFASIAPASHAWGCKGHETVALIAEAHLTPAAKSLAYKILTAGPIDPALSRYCKEPNLDAFADASTWADDERQIKPETFQWHFIDIPRSAPEAAISQFCPPSTGCITSALAAQIEILRNPSASPQSRADALRYIIHFVGDIHQPLHATTNNDQGGNCVPVTFFGKAPQERNTTTESYSPNLHAIWDTNIIDQFSPNETPQQLAEKLDTQFATAEPAWAKEPIDFNRWAWQSHQLAETTVYGNLPNKIAIEKPQPTTTCADDDHVSTRMLNLNEDVESGYETTAAPVAEEQLTKAGLRLATLLNSILK